MKTKTSFGRCLGLIVKKHNLTQVELASRTNITQATISRIIALNKTVDDPTMKSLCSAWPSRADNIQLLIAGLSDVIRRWGFDPDADVEILPLDAVAARTPTQAETDLDVLREHMADDTVSELVHDLAVILRRADSAHKTYPAGSLPFSSSAELKPFA